jgi:sRNA-binding regulator protein Hfq
MANSSHIPAAGGPGFRPALSAKPVPANLQAVPSVQGAPDSASLPITGPRKLVRPTLPGRASRNRVFGLREEPPILAHLNMAAHAAAHESSHAEAFYFQKQVQAQTPMMIVLEDGEQIEGCIEWYDRNSIKVKSSARMLIYKAGIKYIYKAGDQHV